jgi:hypothetical protein
MADKESLRASNGKVAKDRAEIEAARAAASGVEFVRDIFGDE